MGKGRGREGEGFAGRGRRGVGSAFWGPPGRGVWSVVRRPVSPWRAVQKGERERGRGEGATVVRVGVWRGRGQRVVARVRARRAVVGRDFDNVNQTRTSTRLPLLLFFLLS